LSGADAPPIPRTQHAIQFVGPDKVVLNRSKPVGPVGPTQVLARVEAVGICFSDTKLLHAWTDHPRKGPVVTGIAQDVLAQIPSYVPGETPTVPGHEVCARIVAVGEGVIRHRVGERILVQTDYRSLMTSKANAAFGYDFEGGLQEYVVMDERMIIEPESGERFLIPVGERPSASSVALLEPWACVERAYASTERDHPKTGGRVLVLAEAGHAIEGLDALLASGPPGSLSAVLAEPGQRRVLEGLASAHGLSLFIEADAATLPRESFDDIVYFGAEAGRLEDLQSRLALGGVIDVVLGGRTVGRPVEIDVGRIHYDLVRWVGTPGASAEEGYRWAPTGTELRDGDRVVVVGAAGPMGFMHVIRALASGRRDLSLVAVDIDESRLAHLASVAAPLAAANGVGFSTIDSRTADPGAGFTHVGVMVPVPAIAAGALEMAAQGALIDLFAGFAVGTRAPIDVDLLVARQLYLFGTSGSVIDDMKAVLGRLESGQLDTDISVYAVSGLEGVPDALAAVGARTSGGKIVIYPQLRSMGLVRLTDLAVHHPAVAAELADGRWTRAAEEVLLATEGGKATGAAGGGTATGAAGGGSAHG
jgi:threonine dehydrogenase-like Zn-dependent dehydrogenase